MVNSPLYLGGLFNQAGVAMANPAQLAWGLRGACLHQGVRIYEQTPVLSVKADHLKIQLQTPNGYVQARKTAIATNAFPPLLMKITRYIVPVYDYVLISEPLSPAQKASIGWHGRQGLSDSNNQFHYYRMTADDRILWGGYDAVYHWNNGVGKQLETNYEVFGRLAEHFFITFPSLEGSTLHTCLGRRDRYLFTFLPFLGHCSWWANSLRGRFHRSWRRFLPVRCPGDAGFTRRKIHRAHKTPDGAHQTGSISTRTIPIPVDQPHPQVVAPR